MQVNSLKLEALRPLGKWRILDLKSLMELSEVPIGYWNLHKIIKRFEKAKVVQSFKDPWTKRKMIYLEALGHGLLGVEKNCTISNETLLHDSKVSLVLRMMFNRGIFKEVLLEHELSRKLFFAGELSPDAIMKGEKNGKKFSMAFELELTRKAHERALAKAKHYLNFSLVDYVFYQFCSEGLFQSYKKLFLEKLPEGWNNKIMMFCNTSLMSSCFSLENGKGFFKNREVSFAEIF